MTVWVLLAVGGAAGAVARYTVAGWVHQRAGAGFPWGTLAVNVIGSFLFGVVVTSLAGSSFRIPLGALLATGFLGDFTTFSTFSYDAVGLAQRREGGRALLYVLGSIVLALAALLAGMGAGALLASSF